MKQIPYGRQEVSLADIEAVNDVLKSDFLTQGCITPKFEEAIASFCGAKYAIATSNATSALHLACLALEVGPGDIVWTSPNSFVASANCALYCGATVDFVDIDPITYNMSVLVLHQKLLEAKKSNKLPKVVIPVHFAGQSCEMSQIALLSKEFDFRIIEDASHALGGRYQDAAVGSSIYSDITIFSFHPVKMITTGEGGMAVTNQPDLAQTMKLLRSHGITQSDPDYAFSIPNEIWYYRQTNLGYNFRMTEIQAALGLSQSLQLEKFVAQRNAIARKYDEALLGLPVKTPTVLPNVQSSFHLYVLRINGADCGKNRNDIYRYLRSQGIQVNLHYIPIHLQPFYENLGFKRGYCKEAEIYFEEALTLPIFSSLNEESQDFVIKKLQEVILL